MTDSTPKITTTHSKPSKPSTLTTRSDLGNSQWFAKLYRQRLKFDHGRRRWLIWNGHRWREDHENEVQALMGLAMQRRSKMSAQAQDDSRRKAEIRWSLESCSLSRINSALTLAETHPMLKTSGTAWDANPDLLCVANGIIDLRTGTLRPGLPSDFITLQATHAYDPAATCPTWERFIAETFQGDPELTLYARLMLGYTLTGLVREQCFFMSHGEGSNGKSTLFEVLHNILGGNDQASYSLSLPFSAFELHARASISNDIASLPGKRFVMAAETNESARLNEARLKALTGGDTITARQLYRDFFRFRPVCKIWLAVNHRPMVKDDSDGFWRRMRVIPFLNRIDDAHKDRDLPAKLMAEAPGILTWLVKAAGEYYARTSEGTAGVVPISNASAALNQEYRDESDPVALFMEDCLTLDASSSLMASEIWERYVQWAKANGDRFLIDRISFGRRLAARNLEPFKVGHDRTRAWKGVRFKLPYEGAAGEAANPTPASTSAPKPIIH